MQFATAGNASSMDQQLDARHQGAPDVDMPDALDVEAPGVEALDVPEKGAKRRGAAPFTSYYGDVDGNVYNADGDLLERRYTPDGYMRHSLRRDARQVARFARHSSCWYHDIHEAIETRHQQLVAQQQGVAQRIIV